MKPFIRLFSLFFLAITVVSCGSNSNPKPAPITNTPNTQVTAPAASFKTDLFTSANVCASCHDGIHDDRGNDVSVQNDWSSTLMAQSASDPFFLATLEKEITRFPLQRASIEAQCSRCHAPMATLEAESTGIPVALTNGGFLDPAHPLHAQAKEGVGCTLCHRLADDPMLGTLGRFNGNFPLDSSRVIYGSWTNPDTSPMYAATGFTPSYGAHIQRSSLCATCHELYSPVRDINGNATLNRFSAQTVYTEWINSKEGQSGGRSCQSCHMPDVNGVLASSKNPERSVARDEFSRHTFVGGNTFMLGIMGDNRVELGIAANNFTRTRELAKSMLASAVSVAVSNLRWNGATLEFSVKVVNKTGHKFPTGYPSRRAFLHVTVKNATGAIVFESGKADSDGKILAVDGVSNMLFAPHYSHITNAAQVQIYEAVMADSGGNVTQSQLSGASYLKDNRIPPAGYQPHLAPMAIRPDALAFQDSDYLNAEGQDQTHFELDGLAPAAYVVEAELNYQSIGWPTTNDLLGASANTPLIAQFSRMNQNATSHVEKVAVATGRINN